MIILIIPITFSLNYVLKMSKGNWWLSLIHTEHYRLILFAFFLILSLGFWHGQFVHLSNKVKNIISSRCHEHKPHNTMHRQSSPSLLAVLTDLYQQKESHLVNVFFHDLHHVRHSEVNEIVPPCQLKHNIWAEQIIAHEQARGKALMVAYFQEPVDKIFCCGTITGFSGIQHGVLQREDQFNPFIQIEMLGICLFSQTSKSQHSHANSLNWFQYIFLENKLREFDKRSKHSRFGDHFFKFS